MKISGLEYGDKSKILLNNRVNKKNVTSFSSEMEGSFLNKSKSDLKDLLDSIRKKGDRIVLTKNYSDVNDYKKLVKQYLKKVLDDMYELNKCSDTFNSRYYLTVDTIDKKLQELTDKVLVGEKNNISIISTLDEIQGLMIDVYK